VTVVKIQNITLLFMACFINFAGAQEPPEQAGVANRPAEAGGTDRYSGSQSAGLTLSFSGFNEFRFGLGLFLGASGNGGNGGPYHFGDDLGFLFEFNFKEDIKYTRFYYHLTSCSSAVSLGGSMVIAYNNNTISMGFAPEIGLDLSRVFKVLYRYNFYMDNIFNSYEVVFHLRLGRRN
jgi:hypothetical protein